MTTKAELLAEVQAIREGFKSIANDTTRSDSERMRAMAELHRLYQTEQFIINNHQ